MSDCKVVIFKKVKALLVENKKRMDVREKGDQSYHLFGKKEVIVGTKKVESMYFASVKIQKNFVSFYFFPMYTHKKIFTKLPKKLSKCLKGKSCFHIKENDPILFNEIRLILSKGREIYEKSGWI